MSVRKTTDQRADELVEAYLGWQEERAWTLITKQYVLHRLAADAIAAAQKATADGLHYGSNRPRPSIPKEFPPFPFADHRTLAQVDQAKEPA